MQSLSLKGYNKAGIIERLFSLRNRLRGRSTTRLEIWKNARTNTPSVQGRWHPLLFQGHAKGVDFKKRPLYRPTPKPRPWA